MSSRTMARPRREGAVAPAREGMARPVSVEEVPPRDRMAPRLLDIYAAAFVNRDGGIEDARAAG